MFKQQFTQFVGECCMEVKPSPRYTQTYVELESAIDVIAEKLGTDDKRLATGLFDIIGAIEAAVEDDYFKAGFLTGIRLDDEDRTAERLPVCKHIKELMAKRGLTISELSNKTGISAGLLSLKINGNLQWYAHEMFLVSRELGFSEFKDAFPEMYTA